MSLCRYLPTPSDRMSVLWTLLSIEDSIVLEYGPAGTTHYSVGLFGSMGLESEKRLYTTHMSEDDVVMGDVSRLENAIVELDCAHRPKVIFVVASAITAVIGTDILGVCHYMQEKVSARLIPVDEGGFRGDYTAGLKTAYSLLAQALPNPSAEKRPVCNILGASAGSFRIRSDVWELKDLLHRAFGLKAGAVLGLETSVEEIENLGAAALNIVLRQEALPAAKALQAQFGTPYVYSSPYGYNGTLTWLEEIGRALGTPPERSVIRRLRERAEEAGQIRMYVQMGRKKPCIAMVGEYEVVRGLSAFCGDLGLPIAHQICTHSLKDVSDVGEMVHYAKEGERLTVLKSLRKGLLLADDVSAHVAADDNVYVCVSAPFFRHRQIATHLPIMGERGADMLLEEIYRYLNVLN